MILCKFFEKGYCKKEDKCYYAHGIGELKNKKDKKIVG